MKQHKIEIEVNNNKTILPGILRLLRKEEISIQSFVAHETSVERGHVFVTIECAEDKMQTVKSDLQKLTDVIQVRSEVYPLPSKELTWTEEE